MKWATIGLIAVGLVAAASAGLLVATLRMGAEGPRQAPPQPDVPVVVAARALPAMAVVDGGAVQTRTMPRGQAPRGGASDPTQVVGKVLAVPVVEGQALTDDCFVAKGAAAHLAAHLPEGMRAVTISLSDSSGVEGVLYPGCVVDVLACFRLPSPGGAAGGEAASVTLLQRVQVLAVDGQTVYTPAAVGDESVTVRSAGPAPERPAGQRRMVTLLVTPKQAESLQIAMEHGSLRLSVRRPLDDQPLAGGATSLKALFREHGLSPVEEPAAAPAEPPAEAPPEPKAEAPAAPPPEAVAVQEPEPPVPTWDVTVIRGSSSERQSFSLAAEGPGPQRRPE